ncbi:MAG TPA: response regulator [Anaerolineae bacterium]|nr:response regulator [Anaerolineae bacterium]
MTVFDLADWVEQNRQRLLQECLIAVRYQDIEALADETDDQLRNEIAPLCRTLFDAIEAEQVEPPPDLAAWARRCQSHRGMSLSDLLKVVSALRTGFGEVMARSIEPAQAHTVWQEFFPVFDRIAQYLTDLYTDAIEQILSEHLKETAHLTRSLMRATDEANRALVRLRAIYDALQSLGTTLTDTNEVFARLTGELGRALDAQHCALWLSDIGQPQAAALYVRDPSTVLALPECAKGTVFNAALAAGKSRVINASPRLPPCEAALLDQLHARSLLLAPFIVQEIPIGVVTLGRSADDSPFDGTETTLVESVVTQAEVAVQNAGLYEEIRELNRSLGVRVASRTRELEREKERLETLYAVGQELSTSLDVEAVLEKTLQRIARAVGAEHAAIVVYDQEARTLNYGARMGDPIPAMADGQAISLASAPGLVRCAIEDRTYVLVPDAEQGADLVPLDPEHAGPRSLIASPLIVGEDVRGVLLVSADPPNAFDRDQQRLVIASAHQVAQAMNNALLYRREQTERTKTQAVLQSIADGVIVNDTQDNAIVINAAAQDILGQDAEAVLGQSVWRLFDVFEPNGRGDALAALTQITSAPLSWIGEVVETTLRVRERIISARMTPVVSTNRKPMGAVTALRDITREVEADRAKSEFVSTVSHELRTPLTSIKGYSDLIFAGAVGPINEQQKRFIDIIRSNADRLTALINDLLDISRIESGRVKLEIEPQQLSEIVHEVTDSLRDSIAEKGLDLELDVHQDLAQVMGDRTRMLQIVTNLLSNAYKFTDRGWIRISLSQLDGTLRLDVADSGIGISTEDQSQIFERFYRADTPVMEGRGGTGLGLAITRELVELHGGRMWVTSEVGVGSTFTVVLPVAAQEMLTDTLQQMPTGTRKILVVDDERDILALLQHQLNAQGYQVITASTGAQAIAKAISEKPDLITLDLLLPDRHGFDVLRELKERPQTKRIPVIVLSVAQDETDGYRLGAVDYIVKPVDEAQLLESISQILHSKGKILIAEDAEGTATMLFELLGRYGYQAMLAVNGYETLAVARREQPDLILLDLKMPGMDGYEALTHLKKDPQTRNIPILVMSAHAVDPVQERLRVQDMGANDFFAKPLPLDALLREIQRIAFDGDSA